MDAVFIRPDNPSQMRFFIDFVREIGAEARVIDSEEFEDLALLSMMAEEEKKPEFSERVSIDELLKVLSEE